MEYTTLDKAVLAYGKLSGCDTETLSKEIRKAAQNNEPYCVSMLDISGNDLKELGFCGSKIGKVQSVLLEAVLKDPKINNKQSLIGLAKNIVL